MRQHVYAEHCGDYEEYELLKSTLAGHHIVFEIERVKDKNIVASSKAVCVVHRHDVYALRCRYEKKVMALNTRVSPETRR